MEAKLLLLFAIILATVVLTAIIWSKYRPFTKNKRNKSADPFYYHQD